MNGLQLKIIQKALNGLGKLSAEDCEFIKSLNKRSESYELSKAQNKWLNDIWGRLG